MRFTSDESVWYAAYGSNLLPERFATYLTGSPADGRYGAHRPAPDSSLPRESRRSTIAHPMFFAGWSVRWSSPVAFAELAPVPDAAFPCRLYLVSVGQLMHVVGAENGDHELPPFALDDVDVGAWTPVPVATDGDPSRGKYDALLRLPDVDGRSVWTVTTARPLGRGVPVEAYLATIRRGLASLGVSDVSAQQVIDLALARSVDEQAG